jgi:predicted nucleotidyltransferase component of viral defense system
LIRAAETVDVPVEYADRALILGQIAAFLAADRRIGPDIAFKGGAIMRLIDDSPRLSRDLDALVVTRKPIQRAWVEEALSTEAARRVVLGIEPAGGTSGHTLSLPIVNCRPLSGRGTAGSRGIVVQLSFNWSEPPLATPVWSDFVLPDGQTASIPVLVAPERAAEKVRAYLTPFRVARANDAYDLYQYSSRILKSGQWVSSPPSSR